MRTDTWPCLPTTSSGAPTNSAALDRLLDVLERGRRPRSRSIGEPGVGKTRLLAELAGKADARRQLVLSGSASELERDVPFWVLVDALDEYVEGLEPHRLDALGDGVRAELAAVLPSFAAFAARGEAAMHHERYRRPPRRARAARAARAGQPLVLVLDDLHWADPASVELVGTLLQRPPAAPVLLAHRGASAADAGAAVRPLGNGRSARERSTRFELRALTRDRRRKSCWARPSDQAAEAETLYADSGGNPFYLEQLARMLDRRDDAPADAPAAVSLGGVQVPPTWRRRSRRSLDAVADGARRVLEGAAVAGDPFDPELAAAAAGTPSSGDRRARRAAAARHRAPHRRAAALPLPPSARTPRRVRDDARRLAPRRARALRRIACWNAARRRRRAPTTSSSPPVRATRPRSRPCARPARRRRERAPASAARWFGAALRHAEPRGRLAEERVELLLAHSSALAATGRFDESHATLVESMRIVPAGSAGPPTRVDVACAGVERLLGRHHAGAMPASRRRSRSCSDDASPEAVALTVELAADSLFRGDYAGMRTAGPRAPSRLPGRSTNRVLTAAALAMQALAAALTPATSTDSKAQCRRRGARGSTSLPDDELARRLDALVHLATAEMYLDRFEASGATPRGRSRSAVRPGRATCSR